jgi:hypothetical protein
LQAGFIGFADIMQTGLNGGDCLKKRLQFQTGWNCLEAQTAAD